MKASLVLPSFQDIKALSTWPESSNETLRVPLRTEVASSSATRSSRSEQQSPPRSAAFAESDQPPMRRPAAATNAKLLVLFINPPNIVQTFPFPSAKST